MKCILVFMIDYPDINYHVCDPDEIREIEDGKLDDDPEWDWKYNEI